MLDTAGTDIKHKNKQLLILAIKNTVAFSLILCILGTVIFYAFADMLHVLVMLFDTTVTEY